MSQFIEQLLPASRIQHNECIFSNAFNDYVCGINFPKDHAVFSVERPLQTLTMTISISDEEQWQQYEAALREFAKEQGVRMLFRDPSMIVVKKSKPEIDQVVKEPVDKTSLPVVDEHAFGNLASTKKEEQSLTQDESEKDCGVLVVRDYTNCSIVIRCHEKTKMYSLIAEARAKSQ